MSMDLSAKGAFPVLMAPQAAVQRLATTFGVPMPEVIDFESRTTRADWLATDVRCWTEDLPALDEFDEVVSDNLIEILSLRPQAWLSGSFFWHQILPDFPLAKAARAEELLARYRPLMISTGLFAAPYLAAKTRLSTVGMYALGPRLRGGYGRDLLVSCGRGGEAEATTRELLQQLTSGARPGHATVWVESALYRSDMPEWMQPASFTPAMYGRLLAAVIRPGIGTVTDALLAGARLFMFHESENLEMVDNAQRLVAAGLGEACASAGQAWRAAMDYMTSQKAQERHEASIRKLDCDGAAQAARLILTGRAG
ncbi:MAG: hypothetical protein KJ852_01925 [Gammaproteobacteria bacterium]|nr:hypothetical protein [Gammaproteobacteria bacterium]MBU0788312.1 hypothetical protein [Gammaproteobacteria bacterium]MBU0815191.1 hypothetical protein [Gammaproteobacteria bacterium]MBU1785701.1 hypothetical protein [Gammaproteobacteria bacterium]